MAARGYEEENYWTKAGWDWRKRNQVTGPENYQEVCQTPNHPRVGVTWYEALAYGRGLSQQLGFTITLPSEAEWERAARHTDGPTFPWGNEDEAPQRCNMAETGIGHTSAVGLFPSGNAVCGASDMGGNVWEWTRSLWGKDWEKPAFGYPYQPQDGRENLEAPIEAVGFIPRTRVRQRRQRRGATPEAFKRRSATQCQLTRPVRPRTEVHGYLRGAAPRRSQDECKEQGEAPEKFSVAADVRRLWKKAGRSLSWE